jgi:hypothetical protein
MEQERSTRHPLLGLDGVLAPVLGMALGLVASLVLSGLYSVVGVGAEIVRSIMQGFEEAHTLFVALMSPVVLVLAVVTLGIVPAVAFGMATGALIGLLHAILWSRVTCNQFALIGFVICAGIWISLHVLFGIRPDGDVAGQEPGILGSYLYLVGIPGIIYVVAGTLGSLFLCRLAERKRSRDNPPLVTPS